MEPKRQRTIWAGIGLLFVLAVGTGYIPDLMLMREMAAAREEGLTRPASPQAGVPAAQNAYTAYETALRRNMPGLNRLVGDPTNQMRHPEPGVRRLYDAVKEASKLPAFVRPIPAEGGVPIPYTDTLIPLSLQNVALGIATSARSAGELEAAARIANHLRALDPAAIPSVSWAKIAGRTLDTSAVLHLSLKERNAVIKTLGPPPDIRGQLRQHVVGVLQSLEDPTRAGGSRRRTRERLRFLKFWRDFLRTVPDERNVLVKAVTTAEPKITELERDIGVYQDYSRGQTSTPWKDWAEATASVEDRLRKLPK